MINKVLATDLKILEKYYDTARVIDPIIPAPSYPSILPTASDHSQYDVQCHHFGEYGEICKQCICLQAIQHKKTFIKTEVLNGSLFMVTAMPLEMEGRTVALELIKCISEKALENFFIMSEENPNIQHPIEKLNDLAFKDALTELYNRRYIDEQLPAEILQAQQQDLPFSVIMADVDYFKQVNDQYGHTVGDEVLRCFAAQLQKNIRKNNGDWVARYGGEEFLIVLTNCLENQAYKVSEKLRKIIEHTVFQTTAGDLHITSSFGVYTSYGQESELSELIDKVDKHLYLSKQAGRNCTVSTNRQKKTSCFTGTKIKRSKK